MKNSKLIALSAISAALAVIFMTLGAFFAPFDISCMFMASMCMMLPLAKKSLRAAIMTYLASAVLCALFFIAVKFEIVFGFVAFFGLHPIVNYFCREKKLNKILCEIVKAVWFVGFVVLLYVLSKNFLFDDTVLENEIFQKYAYAIIICVSAAVFFVYDFVIMHFQRLVDLMISRLKF
ncbi:MAG TPA: hypothetical protein DDW54_04145 [Clostridiales bacterium]|nr:hypothetical protein [Clostridiales bacterium]